MARARVLRLLPGGQPLRSRRCPRCKAREEQLDVEGRASAAQMHEHLIRIIARLVRKRGGAPAAAVWQEVDAMGLRARVEAELKGGR